MRGRWRLFRQEAGRASGPPAWAYVGLYVLCLAIGQWSIMRYGTVVLWPANGVLLAALLQLHRRKAIAVVAACCLINLAGNIVRGDVPHMIVLNAVLNLAEVLVAALVARRFCGAALDMRRPARLTRFALLAVAPTVVVAAVIGVLATPVPAAQMAVSLQTWIEVEALGMMLSTPVLLLAARRHRFTRLDAVAPMEVAGLGALLCIVTVGVFALAAAPLLFLVLLPLLLIAFRLSPGWSALSIIVVAVIAAVMTVNGYGPMTLSTLGPRSWPRPDVLPILRAVPVFHIFMLAVVCVALPASTVLTERRRLEARLRARTAAAVAARAAAEEAVAAKSRFLSMMSHEMRTPLNVVIGHADLLCAAESLDQEILHRVAEIRRSGDGLLGLVDDILDYARGGDDAVSASFCVLDVVEAAASAARPEAEAKRLTLDLSHALDPHERRLGDARRLRQILRLLLSNAVKFTPSGRVEIAVTANGEMVVLTVADSGPGLPEAVLQRLFAPFAQLDDSTGRAHEGAGMGLALCRRLAQACGGGVCAANRPEGGAVFTVSMPLPIDTARPAEAPTLAQDPAERAPRVLVVDDHPANREVASLILAAAGCETAAACDGVEAVEAVQGGGFDLILMDVRMPRMDGLEATRAIRALAGPAARTPIVALTADAMPEDVRRCREAGMDDHLAKPVTQAAMWEMLTRVLAAEDGRDEASVQAA